MATWHPQRILMILATCRWLDNQLSYNLVDKQSLYPRLTQIWTKKAKKCLLMFSQVCRSRVVDSLLSMTLETRHPRKIFCVTSSGGWKNKVVTRLQESQLTLDLLLFSQTWRSQCNSSFNKSKVLQDGTPRDSKSFPVSTFTSKKTNQTLILKRITSVWTTRCSSFWLSKSRLRSKSRTVR